MSLEHNIPHADGSRECRPAILDPVEAALATREQAGRALLDMRKALDDAIVNHGVAVRRHEQASRRYRDLLDAREAG